MWRAARARGPLQGPPRFVPRVSCPVRAPFRRRKSGREIHPRHSLTYRDVQPGLPSRAAVMMLPEVAKYHFPWEVSSLTERKTLRTFGRLHSYDLVSSRAILTAPHSLVQHVRVCTKFVEPFQAQLGSVYIVLGETELGNGEEVVLKARVFTCVEGINLPLLEKAILEQRKYFQEREEQLERNNS